MSSSKLLLAVLYALLNLAAASAGDHGVGNGGDPRELYLHRLSLILTSNASAFIDTAITSPSSVNITSAIEKSRGHHFRVVDPDRQQECVTWDKTNGVARISTGVACFDRLSAEPLNLLAALANIALSAEGIEPLDPHARTFGPTSRRAYEIHLERRLRTQTLLQHESCRIAIPPRHSFPTSF